MTGSFWMNDKSSAGALGAGLVFIIGGIIALILLTPRVIEPAMRNKSFEATRCTVVGFSKLKNYDVKDGDCSARYPCVQVIVKWDEMPPRGQNASGNNSSLGYLIYKNEDMMDNYAKADKRWCSVFPEKCTSNNKNKDMVDEFVDEYGEVGDKYSCFYNTESKKDVIIEKKYDDVSIFLSTFFPCLAIVIGTLMAGAIIKHYINKYCRSR